MSAFYHLCFIVHDLDAAMGQMTRTMGVTWQPIQDNQLGEWTTRMVFSEGSVPLLELIESCPGSPWDAGDGSRFDHLGFWSGDVSADKARLVSRGAPMDYDADAAHDRGFTYHRLDSIGARVELVDVSRRPGFIANWAPQLATMDPPDLLD